MRLDHDLSTAPAVWTCTWLAGPDAGGRHVLHVGRHLVGRGALVGADDPALEPHHALLEVGADGVLRLTRLAGHTPITVNGRVIAPSDTVRVTHGDSIEIGHSLLRCSLGAPSTSNPAHLRDGALVRSPRVPSRWTSPEPSGSANGITATSTGGSLTPALLALAGAAVMAMVLRQLMFLMFGLIGALVAMGTWIAHRSALRRAARRDRRTLDTAADAFAEHHRRIVHTLERARHSAAIRDSALWSRRSAHHDAYLVSLGLASVRVPVPIVERMLTDVPIGIDLGPGARIALRGPKAHAIARALVAQLVTACGPADLRLVVTAAATSDWAHLDGLPHLLDSSDLAAVSEHTHVVHLTDRSDALALRTSPLRRALADPTRHALIVVLDNDAVPHLCTHVCTTTDGPWGWWKALDQADRGDHPDHTTPVRLAGLGARAALDCTRSLRHLRDPEDPLTADDDLPAAVSLADLLHQLHGGSVAAAWSHRGCQPDAGPSTPIGMAHDGVVDLDLVRDGPHALIAGTTGSGKSELLRSMVLGMAARSSPQHLLFVLVDYKGGATFDDLADLPHVVGVVTDLETHLANRVLRSLHAELRRREGVLREHRVADLPALLAVAPHVTMPRLVVMIDEFAALVHEQPEFLHALLGIAQRGRSLGVHLVLATQRPQGVISDDIRANTNLRIALRLHDSADAIDVVGITDPAHLPRHRPGRAVIRFGNDEHVTFQTAACDPGRLVRPIVDAAAALHPFAPPEAPSLWLPPLATSLAADDVPHGSIGLVDDPDQQAVHALHWSPHHGNVVVIGSAGSGTSTTLDALALQALSSGTHHVYRLLEHHATALGGAITVSVHHRELVARLLHRLDHRPHGAPPVVLVIDTLDGVRRALDDPTSVDELDVLDSLLLRHDPNLVIVAAATRSAAIPAGLLARSAHRWVHHLHDPHDAVHLGMRADEVPPALPGRVHVVSSGLAAQIALPRSTSRLAHPTSIAPPLPLVPVPAAIDARALEQPHSEVGAALGIGVLSGNTVSIELHPGEHLNVLGPARSGRTTALVRLATSWKRQHPLGSVTVLAARRARHTPSDAALRALADCDALELRSDGAAQLIVIDDAELVDDPDGELMRLASGNQPHTTILIGGRPEALRAMYGHWTSVVRRSRNGLIAVSNNDLDGDLLGTILPRRTPVAARPGLMWCVIDGRTELVQVAADNLAECGSRLAPR